SRPPTSFWTCEVIRACGRWSAAFSQAAFGQAAFGLAAFGRAAFGRAAFGRAAFGQAAACFTSAISFFSSAAVSFVNAYAFGQKLPSSSAATSLKPKVAYRVLNFVAGWKKQSTLPSLA